MEEAQPLMAGVKRRGGRLRGPFDGHSQGYRSFVNHSMVPVEEGQWAGSAVCRRKQPTTQTLALSGAHAGMRTQAFVYIHT